MTGVASFLFILSIHILMWVIAAAGTGAVGYASVVSIRDLLTDRRGEFLTWAFAIVGPVVTSCLLAMFIWTLTIPWS